MLGSVRALPGNREMDCTARRTVSSSKCVFCLFISLLAWPVSFWRISGGTSALAMAELIQVSGGGTVRGFLPSVQNFLGFNALPPFCRFPNPPTLTLWGDDEIDPVPIGRPRTGIANEIGH